MRYSHLGRSPEARQYWAERLYGLIPLASIPHAASLLSEGPISLHISRPRQSKLGHFKESRTARFPEISINVDLGMERFLFTLVHEIAHWKAFRIYGARIKPHGQEWKYLFRKMMLPLLNEEVFQAATLRVIAAHLKSPKASSCSDPVLQKSFDELEGIENLTLDELEKGAIFQLESGRIFSKGEKKRTRYLCTEVKNRRKYLIPGSIPIVELEVEKSVI